MPDAWERQELETAKAYAAFCCYRDLGKCRSLEKVSQELTKSVSLIRRWSSDWNWVKRSEAYDAHQELAARRTREKELQEQHRKDIEEFGVEQRAIAKELNETAKLLLTKLKTKLKKIKVTELKPSDLASVSKAFGEARDSLATALAIPELLIENEDRSEVPLEDSEESGADDAAGSEKQ